MRGILPAISVLLWALAARNADAAPPGVRYVAESNTAISITGDIELSHERLIVARRIVIPLHVVAGARPFSTDQGKESARISRVTKSMNPVLLNGNRLCGAPVRWIVVWHMPERGLGMAAFSGERMPRSEDSPGLCGTFFYSAAAP